MNERDDFERCKRRLDAMQALEFLRLKRGLDGAQPVGALGMAERAVMLKADRVGDQQRRHLSHLR